MQTLTPVPQFPTVTLPMATAALKRLGELSASLANELKALPAPDEVLLNALAAGNSAQRASEVSRLQQRINDYWDAPSQTGERRYELFITGMKRSLHDELSVKIHERDLDPDYAACLPTSPARLQTPTASTTTTYSLHLQLHDDALAEVAGALVMCLARGRTLLMLPGSGTAGFASQAAMRETLVQWLNAPQFKDVLLNNLRQRHQDLLADINKDPDLHLEPFIDADVQLQPLTKEPFTYGLDSLLNKQRDDVLYACAKEHSDGRQKSRMLIQNAIDMRGLFGPTAMLELREFAYLESRYRQNLPDWIKIASPDDLNTYATHLRHYDEARTATLSALGPAASPERLAEANLRTRMADDLGFELDPSTIMVSTQRTLPLTGEPYTVTRTLLELALYGLHPGDRLDGSPFLNHTTLSLHGDPLDATYSSLNPTWLARVVDELNVRMVFGEFQRRTYQHERHRQLMDDLTRTQINALAYAAKMQAHIQPADFALFETVADPTRAAADPTLRVQQIKLNNRNVLGKLLVVRKEDNHGQLVRLVMVAADAPRSRRFIAFNNETQLLHELVGWIASDELCEYLIKQVEFSSRPELREQLAVLRLRPSLPANFLQMIDLPDYAAGLRILTEEHVRVALSEQASHTPQWYLQASAAQRQELLALEDAAAGASRNYQAKPHTRVRPFKDYVHQRASQKINQLLSKPAGTVDPDLIVITSERETITYTDMLLNGYDDSIDFIHSSADTQAEFSGPDGVDLSALSPARVAGSVRGKWLGDDYIGLIKSTVLNPDDEGYEYRRKTSVLMTQLQMKAAALRSRLKGHINGQQYAWLRASVDHVHLNDPESRRQHPVYPLQIHIDKPFIASGLTGVDQLVIPSTQLTHLETVQGCFVILPTTVRQAALLYTPQAPDGIEFRLFGDFTESLKTSGVIDYYKDRCRINARKNLSFFLHDMRQGNANKPPVIPKEPIADFADACFNRPLMRRLRDVAETTTGRNEMIARLIWSTVEVIATVVTLPFPPASFAVGALLAVHDSVRAFQALREGDSETASVYILASMLNSLGAAGDASVGLKGFGGVLRRLNYQTGRQSVLKPVEHTADLPKYSDLFPVRVDNEPLWIGQANANGHAPVFRSTQLSGEPQVTGQFVSQSAAGAWQPLAHEGDATTTGLHNGIKRELIVDVSLRDVQPIASGHATGVSRVNSQHYIDLNGSSYQVQFDARMRVWNIVDPANPFAFFGKQPVKLDAHGKWRLIERTHLSGGGIDGLAGFTPLTEETAALPAVGAYELPEHMRTHLQDLISDKMIDPTGLGLEGYFTHHFAEMRSTYLTLRQNLYRDANAFFEQPTLAPRPALPTLEASTSVETLLQTVYAKTHGLVLGEAPKSVASKRLLILNMPLLAEQRVEVLYIEHLFTDQHLEKLAKYRKLAQHSRAGSHNIKHHLRDLNDGELVTDVTEYDYYHLIKAAHRYNIEVRPFSSAVSYPYAEHAMAAAVGDLAAAQKMSNFFGHKLISGDVAAHPSRRWVALLDQKLASTHNNLPGIAELQGAISIRIEDVPLGTSTRISPDVAGYIPSDPAAKADFRLQVANPVISEPAPAQMFAGSHAQRLDDNLYLYLTGEAPVEVHMDPSTWKTTTTRKPGSDRYAGEHGFRWDVVSGWQRVEQHAWISEHPPTAIALSLSDPAYEVPVANRSSVHRLANFERRGLDSQYFLSDPEQRTLQERFFALRAKLQTDARAIISIDLPPRPDLPAVTPDASLAEFLTDLYVTADSVVVGESHASIASKKLIIDNLPLLARRDVRTLYMEHLLTDLHQADLDRFFETGEISKTLLHDLKQLDAGHKTDAGKIYTFENLVIKARQSGIEVRALDCTASYYIKGIDNETLTTRHQMFSYFASRTIRKHQQVMGAHKWIALVGNTHSNTFEKIVPGLAELEGGIGLRVTDVRLGLARPPAFDPGATVSDQLSLRSSFLKGDYRVELDTAVAPSKPRPPQPLSIEQRLPRPGMFAIETGQDGQIAIIHRSRDSTILHTPVLVNAEGKIYVERPTWRTVHALPFDDTDALVGALEEMNLTRMA
ncbi:membrane-targeted effector domain-containing toxin [Pseudomonas sp. DSP3-2-2]|uniref:membrane-targeted effector domain-containing toxin n=1 Tax=unclassified Pseudomonas TaxID=196821 RepID=UPI003CED1ED8